MIAKIKKTGGGWHKDMVAVPVEFFLEACDPRYEEHRVPDVEAHIDEYEGKRDEDGQPIPGDDFDHWKETIPKRSNPCHTHFFPAHPDTPDAELLGVASTFMKDVQEKWANYEKMNISNAHLPYKAPPDLSASQQAERKVACESRIADIRARLTDTIILPTAVIRR